MTLEEFKTEILEPTVRRRFGDVYVDAYHVAVMAGVDLDDAIAFAKAAAANVKGIATKDAGPIGRVLP